MAELSHRHLSDDELDLLLSPWNPGGDAIEARLGRCEQCRTLFTLLSRLGKWGALGQAPLVLGPECPSEDVWGETAVDALAAGSTTTFQTKRRIEHASGCDFCGPRLRDAVRQLHQPLTSEELEEFQNSFLATAAWRKQMISKLAASGEGRPLKGAGRRAFAAWTYGAIAAGVAIAAGAWWLLRSPGLDKLLAEAYTEQRTLELRFPGARNAPIRTKREGLPGASRLDRPRPLIDAEAQIKRGLADHPDNVELLQAKGRADLLAWNYDAAIQTLKRAMERSPNSPGILVDLASAYFERAEASDRELDFGVAFDLLGQALQLRPRDPVALFNRAIVASRLQLYRQAIGDLELFLIVEPTGGWAKEARERLEELRKKVRLLDEPWDEARTPAQFLAQFGRDKKLAAAYVAQHADQLLEAIIVEWIPVAVRDAPGSGEARSAIALAAELLAAVCGDAWLRDLTERGFGDKEAFLALGRAVAGNLEGDPVSAASNAILAAARFQSANNLAGAARARLEQVYSLQRLVDGRRCLISADTLVASLRGLGYRWAEAQVLLERSICATMNGSFGPARRDVNEAVEISRTARFAALHLRGIGMRAALYNTSGNVAAAWSEDLYGLRLYWAGTFPAQRAYQFYADLAFAAQRQKRWHVAAAFAREAASAIGRTKNRSTQAMAWHRLGALARVAGETKEAESSFAQASAIFARLPQDDAVRKYRLDCSVNIAALELARGETAVPLEMLERLRDEAPRVADITIVQRYYQTLGLLYLRVDKLADAEQSLQGALAISEKGFGTLKTDQDRSAWENETERTHQGFVELLLRRGRSEEAFHFWRAHHREFNGFSRRPVPDRDVPGPKETLLTYARISNGLAVWAVTENGVESRVVKTAPADLERLVRRFTAECSDPDSSPATVGRDARDLYSLLVQPVSWRLTESRLLIEADTMLADLPFEALQDPAGRQLGAIHEISFVGGRVLKPGLNWRSLTVSGKDRALVVGAPTLAPGFNSGVPPLPHAEKEGRDVISFFPGGRLLKGSEATPGEVERQLRWCELFHFAGHAAAGPSGGVMLLAGDPGGATLDEGRIERTRMPFCRLAVLSACSTGSGAADESAERRGLVRAFFRAGVPQVIATRWDIDSASTGAFMRSFYTALVQSGSPSAALNNAARSIRETPATSHPYYWAAFALYVTD